MKPIRKVWDGAKREGGGHTTTKRQAERVVFKRVVPNLKKFTHTLRKRSVTKNANWECKRNGSARSETREKITQFNGYGKKVRKVDWGQKGTTKRLGVRG